MTAAREVRIAWILLGLTLSSGCAGLMSSTALQDNGQELPTPPSLNHRPLVRGPNRLDAPAVSIPNEPSATPTPPRQRAIPRGTSSQDTIIRGQDADDTSRDWRDEDERYPRRPVPASDASQRDFRDDVDNSDDANSDDANADEVAPAQYVDDRYNTYGSPHEQRQSLPPYLPPGTTRNAPGYGADYAGPDGEYPGDPNDPANAGRYADLIVNVREQQTGRFMFGVGVNSDAGLTAQVVIDEYNFDWKRFPRSVDDFLGGTAWRGGGQRLRIEAIPGTQLQRYLVNFTEPYLFDTNISLNLSGYLYNRNYFDWDEQRLGGRVGLGYRLTPDLSISGGIRMEDVEISNPRLRGVSELEEVLGNNSLFAARASITHDTRDSPFAATEGHFLEFSFEQAFGSFDYPRGQVDYRRYFLINERPDGSGRHVLGATWQAGISGANTPLYENFFAGGYSTLRGFRFRNASPKSGDIYVGGELSLLGSVEYMFPITADDMLKGVVFCDYGTIEEKLKIEQDDFRVAVGAGLRIAIPAMGPAPIALDFAVPIAREQTDRIQNFSFFVGFGR